MSMWSMPLPLALIEGSISLFAHAHAAHFIILPVALVAGPIALHVGPLPVSFTLTPIAEVV